MAEYYVVLGDVVHSREIADREAFQGRVQETCAQFTAEDRDDIWGDFKILKGIDEFGGVLQSIENLYEIVTAFQDALRPHGVRIVVSSGPIDVGLPSFDVEQMDGEAFHEASERLEAIEDGPLSFDLLVEDETLGRAIADEVNLLLDRRAEWTERQQEVVAVRERVDTQTAAAEELGVSQQAVSNVLGGADWPLVSAVEGRLRETLGEYVTKLEVGGEEVEVVQEVVENLERSMTAAGQDSSDELKVEVNYDSAVSDLIGQLKLAIEDGTSEELLDDIQPRLTRTIEPILTNATDEAYVQVALNLLTELAERTTGTASQDVERWSLAQYARFVRVPHDRPDPDEDDPEKIVVEGYTTGLGYLLDEEPESAVQFLRRAWEHRHEEELPAQVRGYAWMAGFALASSTAILGPSILDADPAAVFEELISNWEHLRQPARHVLEVGDDGGGFDPASVAEAVEEDGLDQFARLEAQAIAALLSLAEWQATAER